MLVNIEAIMADREPSMPQPPTVHQPPIELAMTPAPPVQ